MAHKRKFFTAFLVLYLFLSGHIFAQEQGRSADLVLWDGLEQQNNWSVNEECGLSLTTEYATEGRTSLKVNLNGATSPQIVAVKKINSYIDLNSTNKVVFDIFNSGEPFQIVLALYTDQRYESIPKRINSGLNENISFELNSSDFKFILTPGEIVQAVEFVVYPGKDGVQPFYLDNIRVKQLSSLESLLLTGISPALRASFNDGFTPFGEADSYAPVYGIAGFPHASSANVFPEPKTLFLFGAGLFVFYLAKKVVKG